jgi:hypothetical protein
MARLVIQTSQRDSKSQMRAPIIFVYDLLVLQAERAHCHQLWGIEKNKTVYNESMPIGLTTLKSVLL